MNETPINPLTIRELPAAQRAPDDANPALVYIASLSPGSRRAQAQSLAIVAGLLTGGRLQATQVPWERVRHQHVQAVRAALAERYAPNTAGRHLAALRGTLKAAWRLGLLGSDDYHRAIDVPGVRGHRLPAGREVPVIEARAFLESCVEDENAARGARDAALFATLYGTGCRLGEVLALDVEDLDSESGALPIRRAKGDRQRVVYAGEGTGAALTDWLALRGSEPGPIFTPVRKGGRVVLRRLTQQAVRASFLRRAQQAGVAPFSPHDLRRTFAGDLLDAGADIASVASLMGHASVETTRQYDRRGERARRQAASLRHVPYVRRSDGC